MGHEGQRLAPAPEPPHRRWRRWIEQAPILGYIGNTPLLRLRRIARHVPGGEIYAKAEWVNPGGSVKDRAGLWMIMTALETGQLTPDKVILDSASGNTGMAYAMIGAALGLRGGRGRPGEASRW